MKGVRDLNIQHIYFVLNMLHGKGRFALGKVAHD